MKRVNQLAAAVAALGLAIPLIGSAPAVASQATDDASRAAERAESSAERTAERAADSAERVESAAESAAEQTEAGARSAARKTESAVESAAEKTRSGAQEAARETESAAESAAQKTRSGARDAAERTESAAQSAAGEARQAGDRASSGAARTGQTSATAGGGAVAAPRLPQGIKAKEADDAEGIRDVFASSAQAALTKGGFDDLVERLVDADRNRIGQNMPEGDRLETLDGRVAQIQKAWRDKYGEDFDMNEDNVFGPQFIGIAQGEVQDPSALARGWPVNPTGASGQSQAAAGSQPGERINSAEGAVRTGQTTTPAGAGGATATADGATDSARTASARTPAAAQEGGALGESRTEARNLEQGRDVALVRVPSSHGLPELTVSLIHEKPDMWRIDAPDHVRGQQLYDNLLNQLTRIGENAAQWPADKNDAYRYVSHCVLMAVLDVDAKQQGQQGQRQPQSQSQQSPSQQQ